MQDGRQVMPHFTCCMRCPEAMQGIEANAGDAFGSQALRQRLVDAGPATIPGHDNCEGFAGLPDRHLDQRQVIQAGWPCRGRRGCSGDQLVEAFPELRHPVALHGKAVTHVRQADEAGIAGLRDELRGCGGRAHLVAFTLEGDPGSRQVRRRLEGTHWKRNLPTVAMLSATTIGEWYLRPVDY